MKDILRRSFFCRLLSKWGIMGFFCFFRWGGQGGHFVWGSRRGIKDQKSIDIINTARANKNFFKKSFYVIPAFSDFFFFQTSIHLTTGFLFPFSSVFLRFSHFFYLIIVFQKKLQNDTKKRKVFQMMYH